MLDYLLVDKQPLLARKTRGNRFFRQLGDIRYDTYSWNGEDVQVFQELLSTVAEPICHLL